MGGFGSGRIWRKNIKTTSKYPQLDVRSLYRKDLFKPDQGVTRNWYNNDKEKIASVYVVTKIDELVLLHLNRLGEEICYNVALTWTDCYYGGGRPWFTCPVKKCSRRVAKLYLAGTLFACRLCYRLVYFSQLQTSEDRAIQHADKIRARLGWESGLLNGHEDKPKGMHWSTYERLVSEHDMLVIKSINKVLDLV